MNVRRAAPGEGKTIARLLRESVPMSLRELSIWSSRRACCYAEHCIERARDAAAPVFYLLINGAEPAGVAEFRSLGGTAFLNHIGVSPRWRGQGLGRWLLRQAATDFLRRRPWPAISLDVDPKNHHAFDWYRRLGMTTQAETFWHAGVLDPLARPEEAGVIAGWESAERTHQRFGFSRFRVVTPLGRHEVGRMGREWFRLGEDAWRDPGVPAALGRLDAARRVLLIASRRLQELTAVHRTQRLAAGAELFVNRLLCSATASDGKVSCRQHQLAGRFRRSCG